MLSSQEYCLQYKLNSNILSSVNQIFLPNSSFSSVIPHNLLFCHLVLLPSKLKNSNSKYKIQNTNTKYKIQNTKYKIQNTKYKHRGRAQGHLRRSQGEEDNLSWYDGMDPLEYLESVVYWVPCCDSTRIHGLISDILVSCQIRFTHVQYVAPCY